MRSGPWQMLVGPRSVRERADSSARAVSSVGHGLVSLVLGFAVACTPSTNDVGSARSPGASSGSPAPALTATTDGPETPDPGDEQAVPAPAVAAPPAPDPVVATGIVESLGFDADGRCVTTLRVGDGEPISMPTQPWACDHEAPDGFFARHLVTTSVGPCGGDPRCPSPTAVVLTEPHIRGTLQKFMIDATGACFVGMMTQAGMIYFGTADMVCWTADDYIMGATYETHLGPCGQNIGCPYWHTDLIIGDLRRPAAQASDTDGDAE